MTESPRPGKSRADIERLAMSNTIVRRALDIHFLGHFSYEEALITMVCSLTNQLENERKYHEQAQLAQPYVVMGCGHGRPVGVPCPHCLGIGVQHGSLREEPVTFVAERIVPAGCRDPENPNCLCHACREVMAEQAIKEANAEPKL